MNITDAETFPVEAWVIEAPKMRGGESWGFKSIPAPAPHALVPFSRGAHWSFLMNGFQLSLICTHQTLWNLGFGLSEETGGDTRTIPAFRVFLILRE